MKKKRKEFKNPEVFLSAKQKWVEEVMELNNEAHREFKRYLRDYYKWVLRLRKEMENFKRMR